MPWLVGIVALLAYLATMAPGMVFGDGCELASAAYLLGVPHPTGYPLYMLLLKGFSLVPLGDVVWRTSLASAVSMACAAGLSGAVLYDLLRSMLPDWRQQTLIIAAAGAALSVGFLFFHWDNAVVTEVYALEFLLMVSFMRVAQLFLARRTSRWFVLATLFLGLGLAHHRLSVCLVPPYLALCWAALKLDGFARWRRALSVAAGILAMCLCLYAYLPLRAATSPAINWGNPSTYAAFVDHVRGGEFVQQKLFRAAPGQRFTTATFLKFAFGRTVQLAGDFAGQFVPFRSSLVFYNAFGGRYRRPSLPGTVLFFVLAVVGACGIVRLGRSARPFTALLALVAAANLAVVFVYNISDIGDYCLFPFWFGWLAVYAGLLYLVDCSGRRYPALGRLPRPEVTFLLLLVPAAIAAANLSRCNSSGDSVAEEYSAMILPDSREIMPGGSVLITGGDRDTFTSWYRQRVRRERTDVLVVAANNLNKPWYRTFFRPEQLQRFSLSFPDGAPSSVDEYVGRIAERIIEPNRRSHPIFTSIADPMVLFLLGQRYNLRTVAREVLPPGRHLEVGATVTLERIELR